MLSSERRLSREPFFPKMLRRMSSSESSSGRSKPQVARIQVSPPYFWDFGVYERVFGKTQGSEANAEGDTQHSNETATKTTVTKNSSGNQGSNMDTGNTNDSQNKRPAWATSFREEDLVNYTVQFEDTFESIALKHNMTAVELRRANPGFPFFSRPVPGQELRVKKTLQPPLSSSESPKKIENSNISQLYTPTTEQTTTEGVEHEALLCLGSTVRVPGRVIIGITSGFLLFEPFESALSSQQESQGAMVKMIFALDRRDILGCASVSRINARIRPEDQDPSMLFQVVWKNSELGFPNEQQVFFEVSSSHIGELVDAIYASDPLRKTSPRSTAKTLTSGVAALRLLEESQSTVLVEEFISSKRRGSTSILEEVVLDVTMSPRNSLLVTTKESVTTIATMLPERLHNSRWQLLYDFTNQGVSLDALFSAAKSHRETILFVRDMDSKVVIGAFTVEPWDCTQTTGFFGTGETFVFRVNDNEMRDIQKFSWSGANEFFQTCSISHLAVGGGGNFALCLDSDLLHCTSGPCRTFTGLEERPLAAKPSFRIDGIELWGFEPFIKARSPTLSFDDWSRSPALGGQKTPRSPRGSDIVILESISEKTDEGTSKTSKEKQPLKAIGETDGDDFVKL